MTKHNIFVILTAFLLSAAIWMFTNNKSRAEKTVLSYTVFTGPDGWGYTISINDSLFIKQETIPGCNGKNGFPRKEQAEQTAQLIINKIKQGRHPAVTTFELEQLLCLNPVQYEKMGTAK